MVEVRGGVAWRYLLVEQTDVLERCPLEVGSLVGCGYLIGFHDVPTQVDTGGCKVLSERIGRLEVDGPEHLFLQCLGHRLSGDGMLGVVVEDLGYGGERLVKLRGHLYEVACHVGSAEHVVLAVGEHAVEGMTKLVEHRRHLVPGEQRGLSLGSLGAVAYIIYNRQLAAIVALLGKLAHPGSAALRRTAVEVAVEEGQRLAILVDDLEHLHVGMIHGDVFPLFEREAVDAVGCIEHTVLLHAVGVEVGLHLVFRDVEQLLLHLGRIVEPVVGLQLEVAAHRAAGILLDGLRLGIGFRPVGLYQLAEEGIDVVARLGHRAFERVGGIVLIAHQGGLLGSELSYLYHHGEGVVAVGAVGTMDGSLVDAAAKVAVVKAGHDGLLRGVDDDDGVGSLSSPTLCVLLALCDVGLRESGQLLLRVDPHDSVVGGGRQQVAPLLLQVGDAHVDVFHAAHLLFREQGSGTHEALVDFFRQLAVFPFQRAQLVVVDILHAREQFFIKHQLVLQGCQQGHSLLLCFGYLGGLVGTRQGEEDVRDPSEQGSALVVGQDGVLERRPLLVVDDVGHLRALQVDSSFDGRNVVAGADLAEVGSPEGQRALHQ